MRLSPDKKYCPNPKMRDNMTLYEMAYSMSDSEPQDAQEALPYLVNWLFKNFSENYTFNNEHLDDGVWYNIAYFIMYNFINREVSSKIPEVFRTKLLKEIVNMNLDHDFFSLIDDIKNTTAQLTKNIVTSDDLIHDGTDLRTDNLASSLTRTDGINATDTITHNLTESTDIDTTTTTDGKVITDTDTTSNNTKTLNTTETETDNLKDQTTFNTNDTTTNNLSKSVSNRNVLTDYPQSTVNTQTVGSWNYASGASDTTGTENNTGNIELAKTGTQTIDKTGTKTVANTGTVQDAGTGTVDDTTTTQGKTIVDGTEAKTKTGTESTQTVSNETEGKQSTNTGTVTTDSDYTDNRDINTNETWNNMSGFELNSAQLEIYSRHDNFYKTLMRRINNCFISIYVDEDRDGWIDPSVNLFAQWKGV